MHVSRTCYPEEGKLQVVGFVLDGTEHVANSYQVNQHLSFKYNNFLSTLAVFEEKNRRLDCSCYNFILG
jgi:hypothetical protein